MVETAPTPEQIMIHYRCALQEIGRWDGFDGPCGRIANRALYGTRGVERTGLRAWLRDPPAWVQGGVGALYLLAIGFMLGAGVVTSWLHGACL